MKVRLFSRISCIYQVQLDYIESRYSINTEFRTPSIAELLSGKTSFNITVYNGIVVKKIKKEGRPGYGILKVCFVNGYRQGSLCRLSGETFCFMDYGPKNECIKNSESGRNLAFASILVQPAPKLPQGFPELLTSELQAVREAARELWEKWNA